MRIRVRVVIGLVAVAVGSVVAALVVTLLVASVTARPPLFLASGGLTGVLVWAAATHRLAGRPGQPRRITVHLVAGLGAVALALSVLLPLDDHAATPTAPPGAGFWTLADGTRLSYGVVHAHPATAAPVVVLHGGPGVPDLTEELSALRGLTVDGHDVYAYARTGSGRSSRLADPDGYTVDRAVDHLEQIRARLGAPRIVLIGHSYGAFLAAAYLSRHPGHVEKVVFSSPGSLRNGLTGSALQGRLTMRQKLAVYRLLARPRALLAYGLLQVNPAAAHAFAGDRELDARQDRVYAASEPAVHCPGQSGPRLSGLGFYANQVPQSWHHPPVPDVRPALRTVDVPALVVKGQCDYVDWPTTAAYVTTIPGARLAYLRGAGHNTYVDRPGAFLATVRAFLAGRPVPHLLADPSHPPTDSPARTDKTH